MLRARQPRVVVSHRSGLHASEHQGSLPGLPPLSLCCASANLTQLHPTPPINSYIVLMDYIPILKPAEWMTVALPTSNSVLKT